MTARVAAPQVNLDYKDEDLEDRHDADESLHLRYIPVPPIL